MSEKSHVLIRISTESKKLFDLIAHTYSKKTTGLFEEMCHYYNENYLNKENTSQKSPLNLEEALATLRKGAIDFLNTIEKMNLFIQNASYLESNKSPSNKEIKDKGKIKEALDELLSSIKTTSLKEETSKNIQKLQELINKM